MKQVIAILSVITCTFSATSVEAHRVPAPPSRPPATPAVLDPCALRESFSELHETIVRLSEEADEVGDTALGLDHRSSSRAYRRIEEVWSDVKRQTDPALDTLAYIPISLDSVSARNEKKIAALALAGSYRTALERFIDYTHYAVLYERSENSLAMNNRPLAQTFNFGVSAASIRSNDDTYTRGMLDANVTEVRDAMRGILYPEYRYEKMCGSGSLPARRQAASRRLPGKG